MSILAFAMYKPAEGKSDALKEILKDHLPTLRRLELITDATAFVAESTDGTIIEAFEWTGEEAKNLAHQHPAVRAIWGRMMDICTFPGMKDLPESKGGFPGFTVLEKK